MTPKLLGAAPSGTTDAATKSYVDTSTTPGNSGLSGGAGSNLSVVAGAGISIASGVAIAATVAGNGLTLTSGVLDVGAGNGITVAADTVALASSTAGAGLTYTTGVLAVGANTGITVNADDIAVDYGPDPWKAQVRCATTANGTLSTAYANGQTVDGVTLATGDRILLKNQTTGSENGIYTVNASGSPTRAVDFNSTAQAAKGLVVEVLSGTANAQTIWTMSNTAAPTIGTTALTFRLVAGPSIAGGGLTDTSGTLAVGAGNGITVNADDVALASSSAGGGLTYTTGVLAVGAGNGITVNADDVALASSAAGAGLTYTSGVLDVVGGNGIAVAADLVTARWQQVNSYSSNQTLGSGDGVTPVSAASGNVTITLPTAVGRTGEVFTIIRTDSTTANTITVATTSSQTINGATTYTKLWAQYSRIAVVSNGSNWLIIEESAIPEPWQTYSLAAGVAQGSGNGVNGFFYRRTIDGYLECDWDIKCNATSGAIGSSVLASAYRVATEHNVATGEYSVSTLTSGLPHLDFLTTGAINLQSITSTSMNLHGTVRIDLSK